MWRHLLRRLRKHPVSEITQREPDSWTIRLSLWRMQAEKEMLSQRYMRATTEADRQECCRQYRQKTHAQQALLLASQSRDTCHPGRIVCQPGGYSLPTSTNQSQSPPER